MKNNGLLIIAVIVTAGLITYFAITQYKNSLISQIQAKYPDATNTSLLKTYTISKLKSLLTATSLS